MNCLAHAVCYLDDTWFMLGAGLPDWLGMSDRSVRIRPKHVEPHMDGDDERARLCRGIQQHWIDDGWFHKSAAFHEVTSRIGTRFREHCDAGDNFRSGFLGHIACELLIDGVMSENEPGLLDRYYDIVKRLDAERLQELVNGLGAKQTNRLPAFLSRYIRDAFLRDYVDDAKLLYRLNRVLARVRLAPLPDSATVVIGEGRELVRAALPRLISPEMLAAAGF